VKLNISIKQISIFKFEYFQKIYVAYPNFRSRTKLPNYSIRLLKYEYTYHIFGPLKFRNAFCFLKIILFNDAVNIENIYSFDNRMTYECRAAVGMIIDGGKPKGSEKPSPVPFYPPQIPHNLTWDRTRHTLVGSRRITA
jgi:hypothetical protein